MAVCRLAVALVVLPVLALPLAAGADPEQREQRGDAASRQDDAAELETTVTPDPIVLGRGTEVTFTVKGISGKGRVYGDVNVGSVEGIETVGGTLRVHYRPPTASFPQVLCLALWRDTGADARVHVIRVPLLGETRIPVKTRPGSVVKVVVGGQVFGPVQAGSHGAVSVPVLVAPGARQARVEVTDDTGLQTERQVAISRVPYNRLAMAITPKRAGGGDRPRMRVTVAVAVPNDQRAPELQLGQEAIPLARLESGLWSGLWAPLRPPPPGKIPIRVHLPGHPESERHAELNRSRGGFDVSVLRVRPEPVLSRDRLQADVGIGIGMAHNLGDLVTPRFGLEVGLEYRLPLGLIGLRLFTSFSWSTQQFSWSTLQTAAADELEDAEASVMLIPIGGAVSYRVILPYLNPYVLWGCMAQIVRTSIEASYTPDRQRTDVVFGVLGLAGADRPLGPGRLFLQAGYQWSRVDNEEVVLLGGGVVLEGGYRLEL
jgi:hypothetical protein